MIYSNFSFPANDEAWDKAPLGIRALIWANHKDTNPMAKDMAVWFAKQHSEQRAENKDPTCVSSIAPRATYVYIPTPSTTSVD